jgi:hypothetical protein
VTGFCWVVGGNADADVTPAAQVLPDDTDGRFGLGDTGEGGNCCASEGTDRESFFRSTNRKAGSFDEL